MMAKRRARMVMREYMVGDGDCVRCSVIRPVYMIGEMRDR